jgi:hypothetical protein
MLLACQGPFFANESIPGVAGDDRSPDLTSITIRRGAGWLAEGVDIVSATCPVLPGSDKESAVIGANEVFEVENTDPPDPGLRNHQLRSNDNIFFYLQAGY